MERENIIERLYEFFNEFYKSEIVSAANEGRKSFNVDFSLLDKFDIEIADKLLETPDEIMDLMVEALKHIEMGLSESAMKPRFFNLPENRNIRIRNIRAEHIGKFIEVDGQVKRASEIRPEVSEVVFECPMCAMRMMMIQTERMVKEPLRCENEHCGNTRNFKKISHKLFDARWIVIQEPFEITTGERPSDIKIYLKEDLTSTRMHNRTEPGNSVKITGILRDLPKRVKGTQSRQLDIFIEANNVENVESEWDELEITKEDEQKIFELAKDPAIYDKLVASIAPGIYGQEPVKEAISMQLFGGVPKILPDKSRVRGDMHILIIGDPSTAKSTLMKTVGALIPRGKYVSGKGVTGAGLTATVTKDEEFLGGWVLEAGALVMTNKSLLCIDEFEKMDHQDQVAMHEAMEQQTISIAKAAIVATLPAQTSILAGGNPKLGRFDPYMPIKEQIDIPETLLTRFDLKFALRDVPNAEMDERIAEHMLQSRFFSQEEGLPIIDTDMIKKYVAYSRKNCKPVMTKEAASELKNFYLEMRSKSGEDSPISITPRQYEALMRMAEAAARIQLRETVQPEDAIRAINIMKASLRQLGFEPETGKFDIDKAEGLKTTSAQRNKIRMMLDVIDELGSLHGKDIPVDEILRRSREAGVERADDILRKMLQEGMLFQPRQGFVNKL